MKSYKWHYKETESFFIKEGRVLSGSGFPDFKDKLNINVPSNISLDTYVQGGEVKEFKPM